MTWPVLWLHQLTNDRHIMNTLSLSSKALDPGPAYQLAIPSVGHVYMEQTIWYHLCIPGTDTKPSSLPHFSHTVDKHSQPMCFWHCMSH